MQEMFFVLLHSSCQWCCTSASLSFPTAGDFIYFIYLLIFNSKARVVKIDLSYTLWQRISIWYFQNHQYVLNLQSGKSDSISLFFVPSTLKVKKAEELQKGSRMTGNSEYWMHFFLHKINTHHHRRTALWYLKFLCKHLLNVYCMKYYHYYYCYYKCFCLAVSLCHCHFLA